MLRQALNQQPAERDATIIIGMIQVSLSDLNFVLVAQLHRSARAVRALETGRCAGGSLSSSRTRISSGSSPPPGPPMSRRGHRSRRRRNGKSQTASGGTSSKSAGHVKTASGTCSCAAGFLLISENVACLGKWPQLYHDESVAESQHIHSSV